MTSIGESLRQERLRRDLKIDEISRELKISTRFLEAIEDERYDKLPGGVFAKSFVRQYARYLGLDDEECAAAVQRAVEPQGASSPVALPSVPPLDIALPRVEEWQSVGGRHFNWSSSLPALAMVVIAMLVCSGVYTFWQRSRRTAPVREEKSQVVGTARAAQAPAQVQPQGAAPSPEAPASAAPAPAESQNAQQQPAQAAATAPVSPPAQEPATSASQAAADPAKAGAAAVPPNGTPDAPNTPAADAGNAAVKLEISATEPVWISAKGDGKLLFSGTIDANQKRSLEAKESITLRLGNAGGVELTLNGKPLGPIGPKGQVRTVQFTSGGFQIVAAPKPSVPLDPL